jgi:transposase-like protein
MSVFKRRRFPTEIILGCVRWYCRYGISYRDLAEMMLERGVTVDHTTILRPGFAVIGHSRRVVAGFTH